MYDFRFLRAQNAYTPPADLTQRFESLCKTVLGSGDLETPIADTNQRFNLLNACRKEFDHTVPNSLLHTMESTRDVLNFYKTPVETNTPLDMMQHMDLPANLHIQYEYHRFHPGTNIDSSLK